MTNLSMESLFQAIEIFAMVTGILYVVLEILQKKYARCLTDPDDRKSTEKVTAALVRRGYTYQQIRYAIEDYFAWLEENTDDA